jgi:hypothetical protein
MEELASEQYSSDSMTTAPIDELVDHRGSNDQKDHEICSMEAGQYFGLHDILDNRELRRSKKLYSAYALKQTYLLKLSAQDFARAIWMRDRRLKQEMQDFIKGIEIFRMFHLRSVRQVLPGCLRLRQYRRGQKIIEEGKDLANKIVLIKEGDVKISRKVYVKKSQSA